MSESRIVVEALGPALRSARELRLAGIVTTLDRVPDAVRRLQAPIVVLDFGGRLLPGWEVTAKVMGVSPAARPVALLPSFRMHGVALLSRSHFAGLVHHSAGARDVIRVVRRVAAGQCPHLRGISWCMSGFRQLSGRMEPTAPPASLSAREMDVLHFLIQGRTSREIGDRLFISPRTVENHVATLFRKLALHDKRELSCPDADLDDSASFIAAPAGGCPLGGRCASSGAGTAPALTPGGRKPAVRPQG